VTVCRLAIFGSFHNSVYFFLLYLQLDERDEEIERLKLRLEESESRCSHLDSKVRMQRNLESIKWEEFEKLATTMREFSRSMSPSKSASLVDY